MMKQAVLISLLFTLALAGCRGKGDASPAMASVNGREVSRAEFDAFLALKLGEFATGDMNDALRSQIFDEYLLRQVVDIARRDRSPIPQPAADGLAPLAEPFDESPVPALFRGAFLGTMSLRFTVFILPGRTPTITAWRRLLLSIDHFVLDDFVRGRQLCPRLEDWLSEAGYPRGIAFHANRWRKMKRLS